MSTFLKHITQGLRDMCYIWWLEMKNTIKDDGMVIFFIIVPIAYPLVYSWIYTNEVVREVPVAVVDMSHSKTSREFIQKLDATPDVRVAYHCNNLDEAKQLTGRQQVRGTVYFPDDFEKRIYRGEQAHVSVYCDMSLMLSYKAVYQSAMAVSLEMNRNIQIPKALGFTDRDDEINTEPLAIEEVPVFNATGGYGNALLPAVLIIILQQTLLLGIGLSAGTARENNRNRELIPVSRHFNGVFRIVLGKSLCYLMVYMLVTAYVTLCIPHWFRFTSMVHAADLVGLMLPYLLACIFFGMMMSCVVRFRENVMLLVVFTSLPLLFLTGVSWPQTNIPSFWRGISWLFPSTFGVCGFLRISSMGGRLHDILPEYRALWTQTIVYFFATCIVYGYQLRLARRHAKDLAEETEQQTDGQDFTSPSQPS